MLFFDFTSTIVTAFNQFTTGIDFRALTTIYAACIVNQRSSDKANIDPQRVSTNCGAQQVIKHTYLV